MKHYVFSLAVFLVAAQIVSAQQAEKTNSMELYGFIMMDAGYNFDQIDPNWFDVVRPTKLPTVKNQYGSSGNTYFSVRQTRFGVKNDFETPVGTLKTKFEFEMFGTGADAGQTTIRLRHAYAELGHFGVGQTWSPFMDIDIFPNTVEYWGPSGMVFFRNVQFRWMPIMGETRLTFALERPGASADQGIYTGAPPLAGVVGRLPMPDISGEYRQSLGALGYVELAGIVRRMDWVDHNNDSIDLGGGAWGWGLNLTTNIKFGSSTTFRGGVVYGEGIQNYMNDATVDIGVKYNSSNATKPYTGVVLPMLGVSAFIDHNWSEKFSTAAGYSMAQITNSDGQADDAYHKGQYVAANLMYYPAKNAMAGVELQWGDRENKKDDYHPTITKIQFSFKYNFAQKISF